MEKGIKTGDIECFIDKIITTCEVSLVTPSGIIITDKEKGIPKTKQTVVVAGPDSRVKPGDEVEIDFDKFPRRMVDPSKSRYAKNGIGPDSYEVLIPIETINGVDYLYISTSHLKYKYVKSE